MKIPLAAILCLAFSLTSPGADCTNFTGVGIGRAAVWTVTPIAGSGDLRISIECSGFSALPMGEGYSLRIPGQANSARPGTPDLPFLASLLPATTGGKAHLTIRGGDPTNLTDVAVAPAEGFRLDESGSSARVLRPYRQPDPVVFGKDQFWPPDLGSLEEGAIGTQKVVRVVCCPVEYNPVKKTLRFYRRLEGELRFEPR